MANPAAGLSPLDQWEQALKPRIVMREGCYTGKVHAFRITALLFSENIDAYNDPGNAMVVMVALRMMVRGRTRVSH